MIAAPGERGRALQIVTFGQTLAVLIGVPVAAYPVAGPIDVVGAGGLGPLGNLTEPVGALNADLSQAIADAQGCSRLRKIILDFYS